MSLILLGCVLLGAWFWTGIPEDNVDPYGISPELGLQPQPMEPIELESSPEAPSELFGLGLLGRRTVSPSTASSEVELDGEGLEFKQRPKEPYNLSDNKVTRPEPGAYEGAHIEEFYANGQQRFVASQTKNRSGLWQLDGRWTCWYENGQQMELGSYSKDMETGTWQWWYANGKNQAAGSFVGGNKEGAWTYWYENGTKMSDAFYSDGLGSGTWTLYHEDGSRKAHGAYHDGVIAGRWIVWDEFGEEDPNRSGYYESGQRLGD